VKKNYWVPKYFRATWLEAKSACALYGMELAALQTLKEYNSVKTMVAINKSAFHSTWAHVDGVSRLPRSTTEWHFSNGKKIPYAMIWSSGEPGFHTSAQWCLAAGDATAGNFNFADIDCTQRHQETFICQEIVA
jgi:hypothetical protein